jgi:hypothetical protein
MVATGIPKIRNPTEPAESIAVELAVPSTAAEAVAAATRVTDATAPTAIARTSATAGVVAGTGRLHILLTKRAPSGLIK